MPATDVIGKPVPPQTVALERGPVANFATAIKDSNPVYTDPEAAAAAGFDNIPLPPTYPFAMHHWGAFAELQPEGAGGSHPMVEAIGALMAGGGLILHGEQEFLYHRQPLVGDVLTASGSVKDVYEKTSSGGKTMTFVITETVWSDAAGNPVVTSTMTMLHLA